MDHVSICWNYQLTWSTLPSQRKSMPNFWIIYKIGKIQSPSAINLKSTHVTTLGQKNRFLFLAVRCANSKEFFIVSAIFGEISATKVNRRSEVWIIKLGFNQYKPSGKYRMGSTDAADLEFTTTCLSFQMVKLVLHVEQWDLILLVVVGVLLVTILIQIKNNLSGVKQKSLSVVAI